MISSERHNSEDTLSISEEILVVDKQKIATGRVRVGVSTELVDETARASLQDEDVDVTRVPVGREVDEVPVIRTEGDVTIIPIFEEIMVIEKRLLLKEELHIRKRTSSREFEQNVELRKQHAVIERVDLDDDDFSTPARGNAT